MKTEQQIKGRIAILEAFLESPDLQDEIIMRTKQRARIRLKIDILNWVLDKEKIENENK